MSNTTNPHPVGTQDYDVWQAGFTAGLQTPMDSADSGGTREPSVGDSVRAICQGVEAVGSIVDADDEAGMYVVSVLVSVGNEDRNRSALLRFCAPMHSWGDYFSLC